VMLAKMDDATAASALAGFAAKLNSTAAPLRKRFTHDQGREMSRHVDLTAQTGVKAYFCDPHSPWQRGTCENTNGLIRQYLPNGTDLSVFSEEELYGIAHTLNTTPRATHNWYAPLEVFARTLASSHKPSTSVHSTGCCASYLKPPSVKRSEGCGSVGAFGWNPDARRTERTVASAPASPPEAACLWTEMPHHA